MRKDVEEYKMVEEISSRVLQDGTIIEMCLDPDKDNQTFFSIFKDGVVRKQDSFDMPGGIVLKPYDLKVDAIRNNLVRFPSCAVEYHDEMTLIKEISDFIHKLIDVSSVYFNLIPYYVLFTWIYDLFYEVPYLRVIGDFGTGKSRFLKTVGQLCYKPMTVGHCTASYAFRVIERFRGTLVLDEADFEKSSETEKFVKILNCGYEKNSPYGLTQQEKGKFVDTSFQVFGPKVIATRKRWQDTALESRCLTEDMLVSSREDIPNNWNEHFDRQAFEIRNKLLMWRFRNYKHRDLNNIKVDRSVEPRLRQVITPLLSVSNNPEFQDNLRRFIKDYNHEIIMQRGMKLEAVVIENIYNLRNKDRIYIKDISDSINNSGLECGFDKDITPQKIGRVVKNELNIKTDKDMHGSYLSLNIGREKDKLEQLVERYGIKTIR